MLKAQLGLDVYASDIRGVRDRLQKDPAPLERLTDVLEEAVDFLAKVGVRGPGALPYTYQLVTLAALAARSPGILGKPHVHSNLQHWFWNTTYTEHFSGITGSRIRDGINELASALNNGGPSPEQDATTIIKSLTPMRGATGRTRAFLLFLAQLPRNEQARQRRQERLGAGESQAAQRLVAAGTAAEPGNRVIATPAELRALRAAMKAKQLEDGMLDEYAIPPEAVDALPDQRAFVDARTRVLITQEKAFINSFGLEVSDTE